MNVIYNKHFEFGKVLINYVLSLFFILCSNVFYYSKEADAPTVTVTDNKKQRIDLCKVKSDKNTDYYLKVESHAKEMKERSMNEHFLQRFEQEMQKIADSIHKKSGVKQWDKVYERIGRTKQKYPSIARYFDIEIESKPYVQEKAGQKDKGQDKKKNQDNQAVETQNNVKNCNYSAPLS